MIIDRAKLFRVRMPLVRPFRTSLGTDTAREALLLQVQGREGESGWGECVADTLPLYSSEYVDAARMTIERVLLPTLAGRDVEPADVARLLSPVKEHRMSKAAVEMAVLDAVLRSSGTSFASFLGAQRRRLRVGVSVGITETLEDLLAVVSAHLEEGYSRVKLKIEPGWDVEPVRAVRSLVGDDFMLQVDANTAYSLDRAGPLLELDDLGLLLIEQPLGEEDLLGHVELAKRLRTPICLDESLTSLATTEQAVALGACSVVNLKPGRVGGYLESKRVHDFCASHQLPLWCGGMLETGIGRAANLALAALPGFSLPGDISATERYFHDDVTAAFHLEDGEIAVPEGPGFGVEVDEGALARLCVASSSVAL